MNSGVSKQVNSDYYNFDYFERGLETGKSCYQNYRWLPEMTISLAMSYVDYLGISRGERVLDFGCAKGFVVKALRLLYRQTWGCDVSPYAVNSADNETREFLRIADEVNYIPFDFDFDYIIAKDVFEHLDEDYLSKVLIEMLNRTQKLFVIVPLGKDGKYVIPAYELDITHRIRKDQDWWANTFKKHGFAVKQFSYYVQGIKESWRNFPDGNGFFLLEKK
jgi:SAM-dependent methyltransferase